MNVPPSSSSLADIVAASGHVGYHWDLKADHIVWFGPWQEIFGPERAHPPHNAETYAVAVYHDDHARVFTEGGPSFDREYRFRRPDGRLVWVTEHGTTDYVEGRPVRQRGLLRVIQAPHLRPPPVHSHPHHDHDSLTGRPHRTAMAARIEQALEASRTIRQESFYLVAGVDRMSFVNEAVGTRSADALLCGVADRLAELLPLRATLARVGGDLFGILLPLNAADAKLVAEKILQSFRDRSVSTPSGLLRITVSIGGVRLAEEGALNAPEVMIRAEQALNEAQQQGRDQYREYRESASRSQENRAFLMLGEKVRNALKQNGLRLAFQPVIDTETGRILFYEALARLFGDDGKMIPAAEFIPIVERQGLAFELDRHVLALAVSELKAHPALRLAINVSGLTAAHADWPAHVREVLAPCPEVAARLIIEITETAAIMDVTETRRFVEAVRTMGGQVALDDFGAGFTSIRHLRSLALAIMKIDRELLHNIVTNPEQQHLVRTLIGLAKGLNLKTVAEGVETEDVAQWLRREKVDMMQGYYFGRPSLDRPWLELKGAEASDTRAHVVLGTAPSAGPAEIRVTTPRPQTEPAHAPKRDAHKG